MHDVGFPIDLFVGGQIQRFRRDDSNLDARPVDSGARCCAGDHVEGVSTIREWRWREDDALGLLKRADPLSAGPDFPELEVSHGCLEDQWLDLRGGGSELNGDACLQRRRVLDSELQVAVLLSRPQEQLGDQRRVVLLESVDAMAQVVAIHGWEPGLCRITSGDDAPFSVVAPDDKRGIRSLLENLGEWLWFIGVFPGGGCLSAIGNHFPLCANLCGNGKNGR